MIVPTEVQLLAVAVALHLQDAVLFLYANEGVLTHASRGRWQLGLGSSQIRFRGREIFIPNLLMVHRPVYRLSWRFDVAASAHQQPWLPAAAQLRLLAPVVCAIACIQFVILPAVLFFYLNDFSLMLTLVVLYGSILTGLVMVGAMRDELRLSRRQVTGLCFECLICPPIAANLVRRLSVNLCRNCDLVQASIASLSPDAWYAAREALASRLDIQMSFEDESSEAYHRMNARRAKLLSAEARPHEQR